MGEIYVGFDLRFGPNNAGYAFLCEDLTCEIENAIDIAIDLVAYDEVGATLAALPFKMPLSGASTYTRVSFNGMNPNFLGSDWEAV